MTLFDGPRDQETRQLAEGMRMLALWLATLPDKHLVAPQDAPNAPDRPNRAGNNLAAL